LEEIVERSRQTPFELENGFENRDNYERELNDIASAPYSWMQITYPNGYTIET
jgi:hypothetical protein